MYRHLLVPIDGTELSVETIGQAVEFARALGARITFFHAIQDHASSQFGQAEMARVAAPDECVYAADGRAGELLTKAESAARAYACRARRQAVRTTRRTRRSSRPHATPAAI